MNDFSSIINCYVSALTQFLDVEIVRYFLIGILALIPVKVFLMIIK